MIAPPPTDPRSPPASIPSITPPQPPPADTGAVTNLINLLAKATNTNPMANSSQIPTNTATPANVSSALAADPLAIIQQLAQAAGLANGVPAQPVPLPVSLVPSSSSATSAVPVLPPQADRGPPQPPPYPNDHYGSGRRESTHDTYAGPDRGRDRDDYYDERRDQRGNFRGGPRGGFRGRGRGRRDDRDRYSDRNRDRDWAPPRRGRPSRSRSPPGRYGGRRDKPPYGPPRRPPDARHADGSTVREVGSSSAPEAGKDEFGRDVRPASPDNAQSGFIRHSSADTHSPPTTRPTTHSPVDRHPPGSGSHSPRRDGPSFRTPPRAPSAPAQGGLDTFDSSTFDPTSPVFWTALGDAWKVTHGYLPSQEELMAYALSGFGASSAANQLTTGEDNQWADQVDTYGGGGMYTQGGNWQGSGGMNGGFNGSDNVYGNGRNVAYEEGPGQAHERNMPRRGDDPARAGQGLPAGSSWSDDYGGGSEGASGAGKMQKVGDKWVFVRTAAPA
ncbi:hypothetical protein DAEQUDRAFT_767280 [Daedalea quercina L-15889]|uniref:Uncharacterized protein n=1 Tax=Daedalea quercina L-15889 TaxID=1314783 RepID=A0A165NU49_9APHY|nr:hypothetical protein DAEQUDRAFT_767280 [Daedalea quercina L-15889]